MKKIILLSLFVLLLSGCSAEYNVYISDDVEEEIVFNNYNYTEVTPAYIDEQGASDLNEEIEGVDYYDINYRNNNTYVTYTFPLREYDRSTAVNTCLEAFRITEDNGEYLINTSSYNSCMGYYESIDSITVNVTLDTNLYNYIDSNADRYENGVLTWYITRDNYQNKYVQIRYEEIEEEEPIIDDEDEQDESPFENWINEHLGLVFVLVFGVLALVIIIIVVVKKNRL